MIAKYKNESWRARIVKRRTEYKQDHGYCMIVGIIIISLSTDGFFFSTKFAIALSTISKEKIEGL